MSIVSEIERIKSNIANAYTACEEKGATMPSVLNSANLFDCIASITGGAVATKILSYRGAISNLSIPRRYAAGASIGEYALFGGGVKGTATADSGSNVVDSYSSTLVKGTATALTEGKRLLKGVSNKNYAIFAGGAITGEYSTVKDSVDAYDKDLVKTTATNLSKARLFWNDNTCSVGDYALVGSGCTTDSSTYYNNIDAYNGELVLTTITPTKSKVYGCATSVGNKALFTGWQSSSTKSTNVDVYDENLVQISSVDLSVARMGMYSTKTNKYAIFAGGSTSSSTLSAVVDAFDINLVRTTATPLNGVRQRGGHTKLGEYAIIAGGATANSTGNESNLIEAYNDNLVKVIAGVLQAVIRYNAGAKAGNYAIFAGGQNTGSDTARAYADAVELVG
jgi:hypothetical protein